MDQPLVPTAAPPLIIQGLLELADTALAHGDVPVARQHVASALRRLQIATRAQADALREWSRTREPVSRTSIDLGAS